MHVAFPSLQELEQQRGLAHPRFRNKREKTAPRFNPVKHGRQRFPVSWAEIQVARIGCHAKWLVTQFVEIKVHS